MYLPVLGSEYMLANALMQVVCLIEVAYSSPDKMGLQINFRDFFLFFSINSVSTRDKNSQNLQTA